VATQVLKFNFIAHENFKTWVASHGVLAMTASFDFHPPERKNTSVGDENLKGDKKTLWDFHFDYPQIARFIFSLFF
jgi:hypothetical protein